MTLVNSLDGFQMRDVSGMTFLLQVFDKDTMSKDDPLGEVKYPLKIIILHVSYFLLRSRFLLFTLTSPRRDPSGNTCPSTRARWSPRVRGRVWASRLGAAPGRGPRLTREGTRPRARLAPPPCTTRCPTPGRSSTSPSSSAR